MNPVRGSGFLVGYRGFHPRLFMFIPFGDVSGDVAGALASIKRVGVGERTGQDGGGRLRIGLPWRVMGLPLLQAEVLKGYIRMGIKRIALPAAVAATMALWGCGEKKETVADAPAKREAGTPDSPTKKAAKRTASSRAKGSASGADAVDAASVADTTGTANATADGREAPDVTPAPTPFSDTAVSVSGVAFTAPEGPASAATVAARTENLRSEITKLSGASQVSGADLQSLEGAVSNLHFEYERAGPLSDAQTNLLGEHTEAIRRALERAKQANGRERSDILKEVTSELEKMDKAMREAMGK
ncbi:MAG: hypothetical protein ACR2IE_11850 [Candidatus Sumerlaeaceae bacterium]